MHHNTYNRFCGSWWGSIIGQTMVNQVDTLTQPWLLERRRIAEMLIEQKLSTANLANLANLNNLVSFLAPQSANNPHQAKNLKYHRNLLSLLPLIIFQTDEPNLYLELMQKTNLRSANLNSNNLFEQDILIWGYLLTTVLNHQSELFGKELTIEQIFKQNLTRKSPLIETLDIAFQAIKRGSSLHHLAEQLRSNRLQATAIALAWYCFATTPNDFKLSVQRANRVDSKLVWLITALTSTLSGAYNGMAVISGSWRTDIEQNPSWHLEDRLFRKLFRFWLGIYTADRDDRSCNLELNAIALPQFIQPRQSLKIISQSPSS